jgi:acyl carrier protein
MVSGGERPAPAAMTAAEILAGIAQVMRAHLDWRGELAPAMRLVEDLDLDSLRRLTLAVEVENLFRVKLEPEDEAELQTIGDLVVVVQRKLAGRSRPH